MAKELEEKAKKWIEEQDFLWLSVTEEERLIKAYEAGQQDGESMHKLQAENFRLSGEVKTLGERCLQLQKDKGELTDELAKWKEEWHYVKDGDLPKENQECYFIYSNTYEDFNKVSFAKSNIQVRTGIYSFFFDDDGNQTTEPCFYDDVIGDEIDLSEVYAWKEIVLPELKESE
jgi:hypothetical protein